MSIWRSTVLLFGALSLLGTAPRGPASLPDTSTVTVENFESDTVGEFPSLWVYVTEGQKITSYEEEREAGERFTVAHEEGNKFLRVFTRNEAQRYTLRNGNEFNWQLNKHPRIQWRWRAHKLPEGASEQGQNDTGAALYVTFGSDWLGRPKSIKYTYSSSLPVGTIVSFGPLKVIVVDSAQEPRMGQWKTHRRNVLSDYQQVFGGSPSNKPVSITIWSDSDTTGDVAEVDIDDIMLVPPIHRSR